MAHIVPGKFTSALGVFSTGSSFRWIKEQLCGNLDAQADKKGVSTFEIMLELAAQATAGTNGPMFLPSMAGGSSLDPSQNVRGGFVQLDLGTTQADMMQAAVEGIAMAQVAALRELEKLSPLSNEMLAVGGGARSDFWLQVYADMYAKRLIRRGRGRPCRG